jgi:predicted secreted protein|tara:strand:- start:1770 stop:2234 length:465 start_codon:yes stop_codon:yes gene_type:complete
MANEILGRSAELKVVADPAKAGTTTVKLAKLTDLSISANADEIDVTSYDDAGLRNYIKGSRDITIDFSFIFEDDTSISQKHVIASWNNTNAGDNPNATGILGFSIVLATDMQIAGYMFITSLSISTGSDEVQRVDCSARCVDVNTVGEWDFTGA